MKILLVILGSLIAVVILIVAVGALLPKHHVATRTATYRATPEQLFQYIAGPQDWRPDVLHSQLDNGPGGRRFLRESTRDGNHMTYEFAAVDPPHSLTRTIVGRNLPFDGSWTYTLSSTPAGTTVCITEDANVYNPLFRFMSRFVLGYTSTMDKYLQSLGAATGEPQVRIGD